MLLKTHNAIKVICYLLLTGKVDINSLCPNDFYKYSKKYSLDNRDMLNAIYALSRKSNPLFIYNTKGMSIPTNESEYIDSSELLIVYGGHKLDPSESIFKFVSDNYILHELADYKKVYDNIIDVVAVSDCSLKSVNNFINSYEAVIENGEKYGLIDYYSDLKLVNCKQY